MHLYGGGRHVLEYSGYHAQALCGLWLHVDSLTADPALTTCAACIELERELCRKAPEMGPETGDLGSLLQASFVPRQGP